ncbi:MAG TPA: hypothetical protein VH062_05235 [Polyangiaceae bacterium]|nr:hypothetical protein [Polyangiaceae bacterium]
MPPGFRERFDAIARRVRRALLGRALLDGALGGAIASALVAVALAASGKPVWWAFAAIAAGAAYGVLVAARRRWSDADVALFLDARLGTDEVVTSALARGGDDAFHERVAARAGDVLAGAPRRKLAPRLFFPLHALIPAAALVVVLAPRLVPARPVAIAASAHPPAQVKVKLDELRRVEALAAVAARTDEERARQQALAARARELAAQAEKGIDARDALDGLGKLRDGVNAERAENRTTAAGRQAAAQALARHAETASAADALRRADVVAFDAEMARVARSLETEARKTAAAALDEAREAAMAHGDAALAGALDEQRRLLKQRAADSAALRELSHLLGDALPKDARRELARLDRESGSMEGLAEALASAAESLTPDERQKLAKAFAAQAAGAQPENALTKAELEKLGRALASKDARDALARALKEMASGNASEESARERALAAAEVAIGLAAGRISGDGNRGPDGTGDGDGKGDGNGHGTGDGNGKGDGNGTGDGNGHGGGQGHHAGTTPVVDGSSFIAKAEGTPTGGIPIGIVPGSSPAVAAAAVAARSEILGAARSRELGAVEHSNVPREYRDQVGRYFAP